MSAPTSAGAARLFLGVMTLAAWAPLALAVAAAS